MDSAGPKDFCHPKSYFLGELGAHSKYHDPMTTPSGRIFTAGGEEFTKNSLSAVARTSL